MIIRATIANVSVTEAVSFLQEKGVNGTAYKSVGFGDWGIEKGVSLAFAVDGGKERLRVSEALLELAREHNEEAIYVETTGTNGTEAYLLDVEKERNQQIG